jgi:hypothetical protein
MAVERAGDTEFGLNTHDPSLHDVELTGWLRPTVQKNRCARPARASSS